MCLSIFRYRIFRYRMCRPFFGIRTGTSTHVYQVAPDNPGLLRAINDWPALEMATGGIDEIYDYWVEGRTEQFEPPRWSVIRDVLGWVE